MNSPMRRLVPALALTAALGAAASAGELVEKIVARVNDRLITHTDFEKRFAAFLSSPQAGNNPLEARRKLLAEIIDEKLLEERAKELEVAATDEEVEVAVERVKRQYNLATDEEFENALKSSNLTRDDLKRQMRNTITLQKVVGRDISSKLDMTDDTLRLEYERRKEQLYKVVEQAQVSEIVIRFEPDDPAARARAAARIEEARAKIAAGTPFADVAKEYSEGNAKERGGALGSVSKGELVTALDATLADGAKRPRVWIDWGLVRTGGVHNELIEAAATTRGIEMRDLLKSKYGYVENDELFWQEDPQGEHDEDSWSRRFPDMMKALFATP